MTRSLYGRFAPRFSSSFRKDKPVHEKSALEKVVDAAKQKVLYFTRSAGFEHPVVARTGGKLSYSEVKFTEMCAKHNVEVVCTKDGGVFDGDLDQYDAIAFYTSGVLTDPVQGRDEPPMTASGKKRFF